MMSARHDSDLPKLHIKNNPYKLDLYQTTSLKPQDETTNLTIAKPS
jgi:hypothetical protein